MNRANDINAFVVHQRQYRETSSIVEFFTERGLLSAVCKGVYGAGKAAARLRGTLQPFGEVSLCWVGRGELKTVRQVESLAAAPALRYQVLYAALYLNELLLRLAPNNEHDGQHRLYSAYKDCLHALGQLRDAEQGRRADVEACLRTFEMQLLEETGFAVDFYSEWAAHKPIQPSLQYHFDPGRGFAAFSTQAEQVGRGYSLLPIIEQSMAGHAVAERAVEKPIVAKPIVAGAIAAEPIINEESISEESIDKQQAMQQGGARAGSAQSIPGWAIISMREGDYRDERVRRYAKQLTRKALALQLGERPLQTRELYS